VASLIIEELFNFAETLVTPQSYKKPPDPVQWISNNFIDPITDKLMVLQEWQKRVLAKALEMDEEGYNKYDTVIWSQPKKSGKTTIAAAVGAWVAHCVESPNEISCLANDQEQSAGRIFGHMLLTLEKLGWTTPVSEKNKYRDPMAYGPKGTVVKAITTNYKKEAGGNQGLSLWSELWAYEGERLSKLWEEMTPPPTRRFRMRWIETYAGYIGQSLLLQDLYLSVFQDFEKEGKEVELKPDVVKVFDDLPVYELKGHILVFWDHEHRMPWQDQSYYDSQKDTMRTSAYRRLHGNYWVESAEKFITYEMWSKSVRHEIKKSRAIYALDASKNNASSALVGCVKRGNIIYTTDCHVWVAETGREIDFKLIEETIFFLWKKGLLHPPLYYDPYQCVKLAQDLRARGIPCEEFKQGIERIKADTTLYKFYKEGTIINPDNSLLRAQIQAATAKTYEDDKIRIVKPNSGSPEDEMNIEENEDQKQNVGFQYVDAVVAQSMAAYRAYQKRIGGWGVTNKQVTEPPSQVNQAGFTR
jgi:phage terminase large subunit-like protein